MYVQCGTRFPAGGISECVQRYLVEHVHAAHRGLWRYLSDHDAWSGYGDLHRGIISAGFVEQYQRKSSLSNIRDADIHEIAEIFVDRNYAEKSVEEVEEDHQITIFLILREDLSILPQKDTVLKLNDIIVIRGGQDEKK